MKFALIVAIALSMVMAFFAVQNSQSGQVTFLGWYFNGPMVIILLLSFGAGVITTFLAMLPGSLRKSLEISKLKSSLSEQSAKVEKFERVEKTRVSESLNKGTSYGNSKI